MDAYKLSRHPIRANECFDTLVYKFKGVYFHYWERFILLEFLTSKKVPFLLRYREN